jgi:hypothetical protein
MKSTLNLRCDAPHPVQHLFIHSTPTIQYIIVARITAVMIFLKDNILVTDRDRFYQMKTYTISSTGGSFRQDLSREPKVINTNAQLQKKKNKPSFPSNKMTTFDSLGGFLCQHPKNGTQNFCLFCFLFVLFFVLFPERHS